MSIQLYVSTNGNDLWTGRKVNVDSTNADGPFATIDRAKNEVRRLIHNDLHTDIDVFIRGGRYELSAPLCFSSIDSGNDSYRITYKSYENEIPVISGGRTLSCNWQKSNSNLWRTALKETMWFRDLYADGKRIPRSRYPKAGKTGTIWDLTTSDGRTEVLLDGWTWKTQDVAGQNAELVMLNVWSICRSRIRSSNLHTFMLDNAPGWIGHDECTPKPGYRAFIEHSIDFVDEPGEWFLDHKNHYLYFMAKDGQNPDNMEFVVPALDTLLELRGTRDSLVTNLCFEGISFEHAKWDIPSFGYSGIQAGHHGTIFGQEPAYALPAAVHLEYSSNCTFSRCHFAHTGAGGIALSAGCDDNIITHCEIQDIGGNGIFIGWREKSDKGRNKNFEHDWDDINDAPTGNIIEQNKIHHCGQVQFDTVGVCVAYSAHTRISHNEIYGLPYTGISAGYIWGTESTSQRDCEISYNHIHDVMLTLHDGGAIYTLGVQPGTRIMYNLVHDVPNGHGLYTDQGSGNIVLTGNIMYNIGILAYQHHYGTNVTLKRNIIWGHTSLALSCPCREDVESQVLVEENIICLHSGDFFGNGWPWKQINLRNNIYWDSRWPLSTRSKELVDTIKSHNIDPGATFVDPGIQLRDSGLIFTSGSKAYDIGFSDDFFSQAGTDWSSTIMPATVRSYGSQIKPSV